MPHQVKLATVRWATINKVTTKKADKTFKPLRIMLPKMSLYIKSFCKASHISFWVKMNC